MADSNPPLPASPVATRAPSALQGLAKYTFIRTLTLFVTIVTAVYLTIIIANLGGYVDEVKKANIELAIMNRQMGGWLRGVPEEEKFETIERTRQAMQQAAGLNQPFLLRTFRWLADGLTLNWGEPRRSGSFFGIRQVQHVRELVLEPLSRTLLIFGTANLLLFFATVALALTLTRRYGSRLDRLFVLLSPLSSAPAWVYGVILNVVLLRLFTFSTGGTFDAWPSEFNLTYLPIVLRHLVPPVLAIFLAGLFQGAFAWRTFFLLYSSEEYVEMARAKGLSPRMIDRRYILRPALPGLITSFALMAMSLWQEVIALEFFFNVEGIGRLFLRALQGFDTPVIVALVVTFAYLMAMTVFILDLVYALVDPRVRVGSRGHNVGRIAGEKRGFRLFTRASTHRRKRPVPNGSPRFNHLRDTTRRPCHRRRIVTPWPFCGRV